MILGSKDRKEMVRLRWENLRLRLLEQMRELEGERLLQYGALVALARVGKEDPVSILEEAQGHLTRYSYDVLDRFVQRLQPKPRP